MYGCAHVDVRLFSVLVVGGAILTARLLSPPSSDGEFANSWVAPWRREAQRAWSRCNHGH